MATVDEFLTDVVEAMELPDGALVTRFCVVVEYVDTQTTDESDRLRLTSCWDDSTPGWSARGMFAQAADNAAASLTDNVEPT